MMQKTNCEFEGIENEEFVSAQLILREAKDTREELLEYSKHVTDQILTNRTFLILLLGMYFTVLRFLYPAKITFPIIFSFLFLVLALIYSFTSINFKKSLYIPDPDALYALTIENFEDTVMKLIETDLIQNKKYLVILEQRGFSKQLISILTVASFIELLCFLLLSYFGVPTDYLNVMGYIIFVSTGVYCFGRYFDYYTKVTKLKSELNM